MARITVLQWTSQAGAAGDAIPVKVKRGSEIIATAPSVFHCPKVFHPGVLESKITFVTIGRSEITIQVK